MENKYYVPTLADFVLGFKFELKGTGVRALDDGNFHEVTVDSNFIDKMKSRKNYKKAIQSLIEYGNIRVKQ